MIWGETWAFGDPTPEELDPILLMWWLRKRVQVDKLPEQRIVVQFELHGGLLANAKRSTWLVMTSADVTLCLTDPGYEIDLLVKADLAAFFKLWWDRISYAEALGEYGVSVEGTPRFVRAFPVWFAWDVADNAAQRSKAG